MSDYGECCSSSSCGTPDFLKDPDSTEDFAFNWVMDLGGDTISSSTFSLPDGLTEVSTASTESVTQIFVSGGDCGQTYRITNRVVTTGGRTFDKTIRVYVREQ